MAQQMIRTDRAWRVGVYVVVLAGLAPTAVGLATVVALENFTAGLGTAAFVGFMAALTDRRFTATQYALLSSLMGVPRVLASAPTGWLAEWLGWQGFFLLCTLIAVPGLMLLRWITRQEFVAPSPTNS